MTITCKLLESGGPTTSIDQCKLECDTAIAQLAPGGTILHYIEKFIVLTVFVITYYSSYYFATCTAMCTADWLITDH